MQSQRERENDVTSLDKNVLCNMYRFFYFEKPNNKPGLLLNKKHRIQWTSNSNKETMSSGGELNNRLLIHINKCIYPLTLENDEIIY